MNTDPETDARRGAIRHHRPPIPLRRPHRPTVDPVGVESDSIAALRLSDGRVLLVPACGLRIGRTRDNDLVLDDPRVSRTHARLVLRGTGVVIHDLRSVNGVYVNGAQITDHVTLSHGDVLNIGITALRFERIPSR
ncbi:FHA domain-containing protein [Nocardia otitidiscaviarum]|uniref:FHA domain-containing protein n=1 Tax=Nocardia otitidiscaviarum TaxID=1823 RepID=UPI002454B33D|nr:FHA domain-containing protein [Nocardia otitidiscaviarum]